MKRIPLYISMLLLTATSIGCSQQEDWVNEPTKDREQVLLSAGIASEVTSAQTRATSGSEIAFAKSNTEMKLYASATWKGHGETGNENTVIKVVKATVSEGATSSDTGHEHSHNALSNVTNGDWLYWDDFGAGDLSSCTSTGDFSTTPIAKEGLTIYGIAVDGASIPDQFSKIKYADLTKVNVAIPTEQNTGNNVIAKQDVVISNNVRKVGTETSGDNRHKYKVGESSTNTKELVFKHIYNKITLNFKAGNGFVDKDGKAVTLSAAESVTLPNYNIKGLLDVTTGDFTFTQDASGNALTAKGDITNLEKLATANKIGETQYEHSYQALTLPGREFTETGTDEAITFSFNGNTYKVTSKEIYAALKAGTDETANYATMKSGVHYIFNITVHKTDVKLTATIADWTTVNADLTPSNGTEGAFSTMTTNFGSGFDLYMGYASAADAYNASSAKTGYLTTEGNSVQTAFVWDNTNSKYVYATGKSTVYWPNNATYYHFRAIANGTPTTDADKGDYVTLTTKQTTTTTTEGETSTDAYADVIWGAPYTVANTTTSTPSTIHPALGPTSNEIKLEFFHMMSEVSFIIKSESTDASQQVDLTTAPVLKLTCFNEAKLRLFDKSIDSWSDGTNAGDKKEFSLTNTQTVKDGETVKTQNYETIGAVPQKTKDNKLLITANGNVYPINDLSKINVTGSSPASPVDEWKPGTKYIYTINILKTGVQITAQIKDWDKVEADETIQIQ